MQWEVCAQGSGGCYKSWFVKVWNREDIPEKGTEARSVMASGYGGSDWTWGKNGIRSQILALQEHQAKVFELYAESNEEPFKMFKQEGILMSLHFRKPTLSAVEGTDWKCRLASRKPPKRLLLQQAIVPASFPLSKFLKRVDCSSISRSAFHSIWFLLLPPFRNGPHRSHQWLYRSCPVLVLFDLSDALTQLSSPICLKTYFLCSFIHSEEYFWECCICGSGRAGFYRSRGSGRGPFLGKDFPEEGIF